MAGLRTLNRNAREINRVKRTNVTCRLESIQMHRSLFSFIRPRHRLGRHCGFWLWDREPSIRFKVTVQNKQRNKWHSWLWTPWSSQIYFEWWFDPKKGNLFDLHGAVLAFRNIMPTNIRENVLGFVSTARTANSVHTILSSQFSCAYRARSLTSPFRLKQFWWKRQMKTSATKRRDGKFWNAVNPGIDSQLPI